MIQLSGLSPYDQNQIVIVQQQLLPGSFIVSDDSSADIELLQKELKSKGIESTTKIFDGWNYRLYISSYPDYVESVERLSQKVDFTKYTPEEAEIRHFVGDPDCCVEERKKDMLERKVRHPYARFAIQIMRDYVGVADGFGALHEFGQMRHKEEVAGGLLEKNEEYKVTPRGEVFFEKFFGVPGSEHFREGPLKPEDALSAELLFIIGFSNDNYFPCKTFDYESSQKPWPIFHRDRSELGINIMNALKKEDIDPKIAFRRTSEIISKFRTTYFREVRESSPRELEELRRVAASLGTQFDYTISDVDRNIFYLKREEEQILGLL